MINFQEHVQEPRTLDFPYASIKKQPGENTKKRTFLYANWRSSLYFKMLVKNTGLGQCP